MVLKITFSYHFLRISLLFLGCFSFSFFSIAQDELIVKLGPSTMNTSEQFFISLTIPQTQNTAKEFNSFLYTSFPEIEGFVKFKTEQIKNKEEHTSEFLQYYVPQKAGSVTLSPFILKVGTAQVYSAGKTILIKKGGSSPANPYPPDLEFSEEKQDFHFQITSDKTEIYTGERYTITASFLIGKENRVRYQLKELLPQSTEIAKAVSNDNSLMDSKSAGIIYKPKFDSTVIKNMAYKRLLLYQAKYYPINNNKIIIPPVEFHLIRYQLAKEGNIIWWKAKELTLTSQALTIDVKELPPHPLRDVAPVGQFLLKESINSFKNTTGKTINYSATIVGNGNLQNVLPPILKKEEQLEFYPPKIQLKSINFDYEQKVFNYKILPKAPGEYHFSDYFQWVYFNPKLNNYDTLKSKLSIQISGEKINESEKSLSFAESFYSIANQEKNNLRSKERDENIKYFANIVILFMLVSTAILVLKK